MSQLSECSGKQRHLSKDIASKILKKGRKGAGAYKCLHCGFWHIGRGKYKAAPAKSKLHGFTIFVAKRE